MLWKRVKIGQANECWPWIGRVNNSGYGTFCAGIAAGAHVWAFKLHYGHWPKKGCVLHKCDNRLCCNPLHLVDGNKRDNAKDAWGKGHNYYQLNPQSRPKGEAHANAKLTAVQVQEIRRMYASGLWKQKDLGEGFGVSQRVISLITRGEAYK